MVAELIFLRLILSRFLVDPSPRLVCNPSLVIGRLTMLVETLNPARDGSLHYPNSYLYRAYWVMGTFTSPAFLVSPAPDNQSLVSSFDAGQTATVNWANCKTSRYRLSSPAPGSLDGVKLPDQTTTRIVIFFPTSASERSQGWVIYGELEGDGEGK